MQLFLLQINVILSPFPLSVILKFIERHLSNIYGLRTAFFGPLLLPVGKETGDIGIL